MIGDGRGADGRPTSGNASRKAGGAGAHPLPIRGAEAR